MDGDMAIGNASTLDEMGWLYCLKRDATLDHDAHHIVILAIRTTHPQIFDDCSKCTLAHTRTQQPEASLKRQRPRPPKRLPSRAQTRGLCAKSGLALPSTDPRVSERSAAKRSERAVQEVAEQRRVEGGVGASEREAQQIRKLEAGGAQPCRCRESRSKTCTVGKQNIYRSMLAPARWRFVAHPYRVQR
jgi:hypothetical protein